MKALLNNIQLSSSSTSTAGLVDYLGAKLWQTVSAATEATGGADRGVNKWKNENGCIFMYSSSLSDLYTRT